ncbi:hypothetical protein ACBQ19_11685 [Hafnia alvei]
MKNTIVAKFGGTSVANADAMQNSANIVLSNPNVRVNRNVAVTSEAFYLMPWKIPLNK